MPLLSSTVTTYVWSSQVPKNVVPRSHFRESKSVGEGGKWLERYAQYDTFVIGTTRNAKMS